MAHEIKTTHDDETGITERSITVDAQTSLIDRELAIFKEHYEHTIKGNTSIDYLLGDVEDALRSGRWRPATCAMILTDIDRLRQSVSRPSSPEAIACLGIRVGKLIAEARAKDHWPIVRHGRTLHSNRKRGGTTTGQRIAERARTHDAEIRKYFRRWLNSEDLRDAFRSPVTFIRKQMKSLHRKTIERRLKVLQPDWRRKSRQ